MPTAYRNGSPIGRGGQRASARPAWSRWRALVPTLALAVLAALGLVGPADAQTVPVVAERYDVDLAIGVQGGLIVTERMTLDFAGGPFRHGERTIPLDRVEDIRDVTVGEPGRPYNRGRDAPHTFATRREGNVLHIDWWFSPTSNATRTFEIRYRAEGALRVYPDGDQLYWTAVYADRSYPVRAASVLVHLPGEVSADALRAAAYPERQRVDIQQVDPRTMKFETTNLPARTGLTVRVQFPHGLIAAQPPSWQVDADRADWLNQNLRPVLNFFLLLLGLAIPIVGLAALGVLWAVRGRDPGVAPGAPLLEEPPSDLPAPLVGTLLDQQADERDVVAALVDLANRGVLRITPLEASVPGWSADYEVERLVADDSGLRPYERQLLAQLLGDATSVRLSQARQRFVAALPYLKDALHDAVAHEGLFYENPARARKRYLQSGILLLVLAAAGGIFFGGWLVAYADLAFLPFFGIAILGAALLWLSGHMPRRTRAGALATSRWNAFRRYMEQAAPKENTDATKDLFERYLPYAIVFGLDRSWIDRFAKAGAAAPGWYGGGTVLDGAPIIIGGPGWYGGTWYPGPGMPSGGGYGPSHGPDVSAGGAPSGWGGPGGLDGLSDSLADMLNRTSDVLSSGMGSGHGGNDWSGDAFRSGGGFGGGGDWSGGGAGDFGGSSGGGGGGGGGFD